MSQFFKIHPSHPQDRLVNQTVRILNESGVIIYPTDSTYALGCKVGDTKSISRIREIRHLSEKHLLTLVCKDLSELSTYARVENNSYKILRRLTPGPYTFILLATKEAPRKLIHPKRKTIGLRIPESTIVRRILEELGTPLMSTSLVLPGEDEALNDIDQIRQNAGKQVDLIIEGEEHVGVEPTTVIDLSEDVLTVVREGVGSEVLSVL